MARTAEAPRPVDDHPAPSPRLLVDVHCTGCRRRLGISRSVVRIYCDEYCANDYPATDNEARDSLMEAIFLDEGSTKTDLGKMFGVKRQRVFQILSAREEGVYY